MENKILPLKDINFKDERFRISYYFSLEKLSLSIKEIGLIQPPLISLIDKHFVLVTGWKRVLACRQLGFLSIPCWLVDSNDHLKLFLMSFYENLTCREFNLLEKAEIIKKLNEFGEEKRRIIKFYLPLLGLPSTNYYFQAYLQFSQFEPEFKALIHDKNMSFASVELCTVFNSMERKLLIPLLRPLSQNKQKELLEFLYEISRREGRPAWKILKSKEIKEIISSENLSPFQKANKIRLLLKKRRYPHLSSWQEAFDSFLKKASWPKEVAIDHSPYFEGKEMVAHFKFKDDNEFRERLLKLQKVASKAEFSQIFKLSRHE